MIAFGLLVFFFTVGPSLKNSCRLPVAVKHRLEQCHSVSLRLKVESFRQPCCHHEPTREPYGICDNQVVFASLQGSKRRLVQFQLVCWNRTSHDKPFACRSSQKLFPILDQAKHVSVCVHHRRIARNATAYRVTLQAKTQKQIQPDLRISRFRIAHDAFGSVTCATCCSSSRVY